MDQRQPGQGAGEHPRSPDPSWAGAGLGLAQGLAIWALLRDSDAVWSASRSALLHLAVAIPAAWYLLGGAAIPQLRRIVVACAIGLLLAALAAHAASSSTDGSSPGSFVFAGAILAYMLVVLAAGYDAVLGRFVYPRLFEFAWRNAILVAVAAALTGTLWLVLGGAAWLLAAIGIDAPKRLLSEPLAISLLTGAAFGTFILRALARAEALVTLRRFWLALNMWFLPLSLVLAIVWIAALATTGMTPLFATRHAASIVFWFAALSVLFMNAAWEDGEDAPFRSVLATAVPWAWLGIPVLAVVGSWALGLRIVQHGWTVDRIWAALVGAMALLYALGYAASLCMQRRWMQSVAATNILAAIVLCAAIVALIGPVADARKLAVAHQLSRLRSGAVAAASFDFGSLRREGGRYGADALAALAVDKSFPEPVRVAAAAARDGTPSGPAPQDTGRALVAARTRVQVVPTGAVPDPALLEWLARPGADWDERSCLDEPSRCAFWVVELERPAVQQVVVLQEKRGTVTATLYSREAAGWRRQGDLRGPGLPLSEWLNAVKAGTARAVAPRWPDVLLGDRRFSLNRSD